MRRGPYTQRMKSLTSSQFLDLPVGQRLKVLRLRADLTQEQLAEAVRLTRNTIVSIENGKWHRMSVQTLLKIASVLGVKCGAILD